MTTKNLEDKLDSLADPILIVDTCVGKGNISVGAALRELLSPTKIIDHVTVENFLPPKAINEDLTRYKFISSHFPVLLNLIYRVPILYLRKKVREDVFGTTQLDTLKNLVVSRGVKTVITISHRPCFWLSLLKKRFKLDFKLWGVLTEFGRSLGWQYIYWEQVDGFLSPIEKDGLTFPFSPSLVFLKTRPICQKKFQSLSITKGDKNKVLFVVGYWGGIFNRKAIKLIKILLWEFPNLEFDVVCGSDVKMHDNFRRAFTNNRNVHIYGALESIDGLLSECASIITKPGYSTLTEAHASGRAVFLLKGMPVAEDHNASYAIKHFGAKWFSVENFKAWYHGQQ